MWISREFYGEVYGEVSSRSIKIDLVDICDIRLYLCEPTVSIGDSFVCDGDTQFARRKPELVPRTLTHTIHYDLIHTGIEN